MNSIPQTEFCRATRNWFLIVGNLIHFGISVELILNAKSSKAGINYEAGL